MFEVEPAFGVDGDVHAHGIARCPRVENLLAHLHEKRVLAYPGVRRGETPVARDGPRCLRDKVPLHAFHVLAQLFGELDPQRVVDGETGPVFFVLRPGVARDRVEPAVGGERGSPVERDFDALVLLLGVGDDCRRELGACGERPVVLEEQRVALDLRRQDESRVAGHAHTQVVFGNRLVENKVGDREGRYVLVALLVGIHDVARLDAERDGDGSVLRQVGAADVLARFGGEPRQHRGG